MKEIKPVDIQKNEIEYRGWPLLIAFIGSFGLPGV